MIPIGEAMLAKENDANGEPSWTGRMSTLQSIDMAAIIIRFK
jgi:hypothetical protein